MLRFEITLQIFLDSSSKLQNGNNSLWHDKKTHEKAVYSAAVG